MKSKIYILVFVLYFACGFSLKGQSNSNAPQRTPEQEATKQTEKLQQELDLTGDQAKRVYEINLKYARQRQISNTRAQAVERMKSKDADLRQVLNSGQYSQLQSMRYEGVPAQTREPQQKGNYTASPERMDDRRRYNTRSNDNYTTRESRTRNESSQPERRYGGSRNSNYTESSSSTSRSAGQGGSGRSSSSRSAAPPASGSRSGSNGSNSSRSSQQPVSTPRERR